MPRYAILEHDHPFLHWDLMLEAGASLRTWRLAEPPAAGQGGSATDLALHRLMYLDYEGPVSGGRGHVRRRDAGSFTWIEEREDRVVVDLAGDRLQGRLELRRVDGNGWRWRIEDRQHKPEA